MWQKLTSAPAGEGHFGFLTECNQRNTLLLNTWISSPEID